MPVLSQIIIATLASLFSFQIVSADTTTSVPSFTFGSSSQVFSNGYTPPVSPTFTLTAVFTSDASAEAAAASKASATAQVSSGATVRYDQPKNIYLSKMCKPVSNKGGPDQLFPCNKAFALMARCILGDDYANNATKGIAPPHPLPQARSSDEQHQCLCPGGKGQDYFQNYEGCNKCLELHGGRPTNDGPAIGYKYYPTSLIQSISSKYCALATPTPFLSYFDAYLRTDTMDYGTTTGGVDKLISKTDISLYFTSTQVKAAVTTSRSSAVTPNPTTTAAAAAATGKNSQSSASATSTAAADSVGVPGVLGVGMLGIALAL